MGQPTDNIFRTKNKMDTNVQQFPQNNNFYGVPEETSRLKDDQAAKRPEKEEKTAYLYIINYNNCKKVQIGQTKRLIRMGFQEHVKETEYVKGNESTR